ncbi:hypothetical protein HK104_005148 [Borealophlyctis nickersoniae]|nr:hypothetical protein HK104_005148 [Borealophlyctis nickersoniae]
MAARDPLLLTNLQDEDAEGVCEDCELDPFENADLSWSDEAPSLKRLHQHVQRESSVRRRRRKLAERNFDQDQAMRGYGRAQIMHLRSKTDSPEPSAAILSPPHHQHTRRHTLSETVSPQYDEDIEEEEEEEEDEHNPLTTDFIFSYFTTLRLHDRKINCIDSAMTQFKNLKELSLTGNWVEVVENLPSGLEILHLNANRYQFPLQNCDGAERLPITRCMAAEI